MAASNSNRLLLIGVLVFVVGVVLVLLVFWGLNNEEPTQVVTESPTDSTQPQPQPTVAGPILRFPSPLEVPTDMEGVAIAMGSVRGLAATPIPGDMVNIYQLQSVEAFLLEDPLDPVSPPILPDSATLLHPQIEVLAVSGSPGGAEEVTFIIAVEPGDVAELLPLIEAKQLWFTLLPQPEEDTTEAAA